MGDLELERNDVLYVWLFEVEIKIDVLGGC